MNMIPPASLPIPPPSVASPRDAALLEAAQNLEAAFLAEMLQSAGLGQTSESFGGGVGEDQFGSFLVHEQAKHIVKGGGIGLAQSLFEALKEKTNEA